jgi:hypothetical protein
MKPNLMNKKYKKMHPKFISQHCYTSLHNQNGTKPFLYILEGA